MRVFDMFKKNKKEVEEHEEVKEIDSDDKKIKKHSSPNNITKDNYKSMKKCPVCKNDIFDDYDICRECFWEYDPIQVENPNYFGGANHLSLNEYKKLYEQLKKQYWDFSCKDEFYKDLILKLEKERSRQHYLKNESSNKNIEFNKFYTIKKQILKESAITFFTKIKINSGTYNNGIISVLDIGISKEISEAWSWKFNNVFIPIIITSFGDMMLYNKENKYFYYYQPQIDDLIWITNDASEFFNKFMTVNETRNILLHEEKFNKVCSNIGYLKYNEVYILVPWIMFGGYDKIENYTVGNLFVYLDLVSQTLMKKNDKKRFKN